MYALGLGQTIWPVPGGTSVPSGIPTTAYTGGGTVPAEGTTVPVSSSSTGGIVGDVGRWIVKAGTWVFEKLVSAPGTTPVYQAAPAPSAMPSYFPWLLGGGLVLVVLLMRRK